jgi:hypothetical protein
VRESDRRDREFVPEIEGEQVEAPADSLLGEWLAASAVLLSAVTIVVLGICAR